MAAQWTLLNQYWNDSILTSHRGLVDLNLNNQWQLRLLYDEDFDRFLRESEMIWHQLGYIGQRIDHGYVFRVMRSNAK